MSQDVYRKGYEDGVEKGVHLALLSLARDGHHGTSSYRAVETLYLSLIAHHALPVVDDESAS